MYFIRCTLQGKIICHLTRMDNNQQLADILVWQKKIYEEIKVIQFHLNIVEHQTTPLPPQPKQKSVCKKAFEELVGVKQKTSFHREAMRYSGEENGECRIA